MKSQTQAVVLGILGGLVFGLLLGFIPEYVHNSNQQQQISKLGNENSSVQRRLSQTEDDLMLSRFAMRAGVVSAQANANNYSVASGAASSLFTDMRHYIDSAPSGQAKPQMEQILAARDRTITGLAQASSEVKPLLRQEFLQLESVASASH